MSEYVARISYTIDKDHPDRKYIENWTENKEFHYDDIYKFSDNYCGNPIAYIKNDLRLVAGGGYNSEHIHNVKFKITKID